MDTPTVTGACHCKRVRYQVIGEKVFEFLCFCTDCRVLSAGGHLAGIAFPKDEFSFEGPVQTYEYPGGSGKTIHAHFCPHCSTGLFGFLDSNQAVVVLRANTLDDPSLFSPTHQLFTESAYPWDCVLENPKG